MVIAAIEKIQDRYAPFLSNAGEHRIKMAATKMFFVLFVTF